ncbi:MAG: nuclear transport factor 2 family protein [Planctomycetota bacterium]
MTTQEIGNRLVELCRTGDFMTALTELYADDASQIEPMAMGPNGRETKGKDALIKMHEEFGKSTEVHGVEVSDAWPHEDKFICTMKMDNTPSEGPMAGKRHTVEEACLYTVADGKITKVEFFYAIPGA